MMNKWDFDSVNQLCSLISSADSRTTDFIRCNGDYLPFEFYIAQNPDSLNAENHLITALLGCRNKEFYESLKPWIESYQSQLVDESLYFSLYSLADNYYENKSPTRDELDTIKNYCMFLVSDGWKPCNAYMEAFYWLKFFGDDIRFIKFLIKSGLKLDNKHLTADKGLQIFKAMVDNHNFDLAKLLVQKNKQIKNGVYFLDGDSTIEGVDYLSRSNWPHVYVNFQNDAIVNATRCNEDVFVHACETALIELSEGYWLKIIENNLICVAKLLVDRHFDSSNTEIYCAEFKSAEMFYVIQSSNLTLESISICSTKEALLAAAEAKIPLYRDSIIRVTENQLTGLDAEVADSYRKTGIL